MYAVWVMPCRVCPAASRPDGDGRKSEGDETVSINNRLTAAAAAALAAADLFLKKSKMLAGGYRDV